ncbi:MAG: glycerate kinase [Actinomycetota bacterium]|nr:glycerate kinase [Actinomycetota bacterium]
MHVVAAPDKFRGTLNAPDVATAVARAVEAAGGTVDTVPVADGGEGTLHALGGANRRTVVTGPLGDLVEAGWRCSAEGSSRQAVLEMAQASGLDLVGGARGNDAVAASTHGTGELVAAALDAGCRRIVLGVGGSASTDGGLGALRALEPLARLRGVELVVACDVRTTFVDAARVFAPQKGATPAQVELLHRRLERLAQVYQQVHGVEVRSVPGSGAAGGLAGGLAAVGARLVAGFDLVAEEVGLADHLDGADLVVTGEGFLDDQSFAGKAVGGVAELARAAGVPVLVVAGEVLEGVEVPEEVAVIALVERCGRERALHDTAACVEEAVAEHLGRR